VAASVPSFPFIHPGLHFVREDGNGTLGHKAAQATFIASLETDKSILFMIEDPKLANQLTRALQKVTPWPDLKP
jgi:hypothetical protein